MRMIVLPNSFSSVLRKGVHFLSSLAVLTISARGLTYFTLAEVKYIIVNAMIFLIAGYTGIFIRSIGYNIVILIAEIPTILFTFISYFYYNNILVSPQIKEGYIWVSMYCLIGMMCTFVFVISRIWKYVAAKYEALSSKGGANRV